MNNGNPELITASGLKRWAETKSRDAQSYFPELIRRLLVETPEASEISIRTGDGVSLPGYDGEAIIKKPTKLLPAGLLRFEFGTNKDPNKKATEDYNKRKEKASSDEVFVFVTPRRWRNKEEWVSRRQAEGSFKEVKALDADDLELWLQLAPSAHIWISEKLDLHPRDAITLEKWWDEFSKSTDPSLPVKLFVAGRNAAARDFRSMLGGDPRLISIRSEWEDDALGFLAAVLTEQNETNFSNTSPTIIRSAEVWDRITASPGSGVLIPLFYDPNTNCAISNGRHVVEVLDSNTARRGKDVIELPRLNRSEAVDAFRSEGVEWRQADSLALLARRSMPALVREISCSSRIQRPGWSRSSSANTLSALMLAGRWMEDSNYEDLQVISELADISLKDLESFISEATQGPDPAIRKVGSIFIFTSPKQAFLELGSMISLNLASRWAKIVSRVLLEPDLLEGLNLKQKIEAQMEGKQRTFSPILRSGLADSLALAGAINSLGDGTKLTEKVVSNILRQVTSDNDEDHTWLDIVDVLPLLAEAEPEIFLSALEDDLNTDNPSVAQLFQESRDFLGLDSQYKHHNLLRALETLCWSPEHLVSSIRILTNLCQYDLPKNSGDTPLISMSNSLCGWVRNTNADIPTRIQSIIACHLTDSLVGWNLIQKLWSNNYSVVSSLARPRYRYWEPDSKIVPAIEGSNFISEIVNQAIDWIREDNSKLPWLVEALAEVSAEDFDKIITFFEVELISDKLNKDTRLCAFEKARNIAARYKHLVITEQTISKEQKDRLNTLVASLEPSDDPRKFTYLFSWDPNLPNVDTIDNDEYSLALQDARHKAFDEIFSQSAPWDHLEAIAKRAGNPSQVGYTLALYNRTDTLDAILRWLGSDCAPLQEAATTWVNHHLEIKGPALLEHILGRDDFTGKARELFISSIPTTSRFWHILYRYPDDYEAFWTRTQFFFTTEEDMIIAIEKLIDQKRPWSAINVASRGIPNSPSGKEENLLESTLLLSILHAAIAQEPNPSEILPHTLFGIKKILDYLFNIDAPLDNLTTLVFAYFPLLQHHHEPLALSYALGVNPDLFVDLVRHMRKKKQNLNNSNSSLDLQPIHAWQILYKWHGFPGRRKDGTLDESMMKTWIKQVRLKLSKFDLIDEGDFFIGQAFRNIPVDPKDIWPPEPIRDLIESLRSNHLDNGILIGCINSRGPTSILDGGTEERKLAEQYKKDSLTVQARWPRTFRILRRIANLYTKEAHRENQEAQIYQDLD